MKFSLRYFNLHRYPKRLGAILIAQRESIRKLWHVYSFMFEFPHIECRLKCRQTMPQYRKNISHALQKPGHKAPSHNSLSLTNDQTSGMIHSYNTKMILSRLCRPAVRLEHFSRTVDPCVQHTALQDHQQNILQSYHVAKLSHPTDVRQWLFFFFAYLLFSGISCSSNKTTLKQ